MDIYLLILTCGSTVFDVCLMSTMLISKAMGLHLILLLSSLEIGCSMFKILQHILFIEIDRLIQSVVPKHKYTPFSLYRIQRFGSSVTNVDNL